MIPKSGLLSGTCFRYLFALNLNGRRLTFNFGINAHLAALAPPGTCGYYTGSTGTYRPFQILVPYL